MTDRKRKFVAAGSIIAFLLIILAIVWFAGKPIVEFASDPDAFRAWVESSGIWAKLAFVGMMLLQIFVAFIPGEPLEICAGYAFGTLEGTVLCMLGAIVGSALVFIFVRRIGIKAVEVFFPREKIDSLRFLQDEKRLNLLVFILFFIPGTPKDILSYCVGLTQMKFHIWMLISGIARIPSIITSTIGGDALGMGNTTFAIIVFGITLVISAAGLIAYKKICSRKQGSEKNIEAKSADASTSIAASGHEAIG